MKNEIIIYQPDADNVQLEVRIDEETVWLILQIVRNLRTISNGFILYDFTPSQALIYLGKTQFFSAENCEIWAVLRNSY